MKYRIQIQQIFGGNWSNFADATANAEWLQCDNIKPRTRAQGFAALEKKANEYSNGAPHRLVMIRPSGSWEVIETITRGTAYFPAPEAPAMVDYVVTLKSTYSHTTKVHQVEAASATDAGQKAIAAQGGGAEWVIADLQISPASPAPVVIPMGGYDFVDCTGQTSPTFAPVAVPELKIDALLYAGRKMQANAKIERRIVANLIAYLAFHGWTVSSVYDGEEDEPASDMVSAMELIFNLDEARLYFFKDVEGVRHPPSVYIVLGNGVDCLADWNYAKDDADGFNRVMEGFNTEDYV